MSTRLTKPRSPHLPDHERDWIISRYAATHPHVARDIAAAPDFDTAVRVAEKGLRNAGFYGAGAAGEYGADSFYSSKRGIRVIATPSLGSVLGKKSDQPLAWIGWREVAALVRRVEGPMTPDGQMEMAL